MPASNRQLVKRSLAGDGDAFGDLVERFTPAVRATVLAQVRDPDAVDDLVQDTFCQAYGRLGQLRAPERLAGWLCEIAHNVAIRWRWRENKRVDVEEVGGQTAITAPRFVSPDEELAQRQERGMLWAEIDALEPQTRMLILLRYVEDCSYRQISYFLDMPVATVYFRLAKAQRELGHQLAGRLGVAAPREDAGERARVMRRAVLAALPVVWSVPADARVPTAMAFWSHLTPRVRVIGVCVIASGGIHLATLLWPQDAEQDGLPLAAAETAALGVVAYTPTPADTASAAPGMQQVEVVDDATLDSSLRPVALTVSAVAAEIPVVLPRLGGNSGPAPVNPKGSDFHQTLAAPAPTANPAPVGAGPTPQPAIVELQRLRLYGQGSGSDTGNFLAALVDFLQQECGIAAHVSGGVAMDFLDARVLEAPLQFLFQGGGEPSPDPDEVVDLRPGEAVRIGMYMNRGGLLYIEGDRRYLAQMARILKDQAPAGSRLRELPLEHALYDSWFSLAGGFPGENKTSTAPAPGQRWYYPAQDNVTTWGDALGIWGVEDAAGRLLAVLSDLDLFRDWEEELLIDEAVSEPVEPAPRRPRLMAATNLVVLALAQQGWAVPRRH